MNPQKLTEYIKTQLKSAFTREEITSQLLSQGYKKTDIDSAFQLLSGPPTVATQPQINKKYGFYIVFSLIALLCIVMIFIIFSHTNKSTTLSKKQTLSPDQQITGQTTPNTQQNTQMENTQSPTATSNDSALFVSQKGGYRFNYLKTWKANNNSDIAVYLTAPGNPKADECANFKETSSSCDVSITPVAYDTGPDAKSPADQIKAILSLKAEKVIGPKSATNPSAIRSTPITPVAYGSLAGFEAPTLIFDPKNGNTLTDNIVLEGKKQMYLIEFTKETSPKNFDAGRIEILKSFTEL